MGHKSQEARIGADMHQMHGLDDDNLEMSGSDGWSETTWDTYIGENVYCNMGYNTTAAPDDIDVATANEVAHQLSAQVQEAVGVRIQKTKSFMRKRWASDNPAEHPERSKFELLHLFVDNLIGVCNRGRLFKRLILAGRGCCGALECMRCLLHCSTVCQKYEFIQCQNTLQLAEEFEISHDLFKNISITIRPKKSKIVIKFKDNGQVLELIMSNRAKMELEKKITVVVAQEQEQLVESQFRADNALAQIESVDIVVAGIKYKIYDLSKYTFNDNKPSSLVTIAEQ